MSTSTQRLAGKVALVTGAGSGIGRQVVRRFAEEGASVVAIDVDGEGLDGTVADLAGAAVACVGDVSNDKDVRGAVQTAVSSFGALDVLVNNAGILVSGLLADTSDEAWQSLVDVNLKGVFLCCRAALPVMVGNGGGNVVNIGSGAALHPPAEQAVYAATKGAVHSLTLSIVVGYSRHGIRANTIAPGPIDTPMSRRRHETIPGLRQQVVARVPLGRMGTPVDVANTALFLASDDADFITGQLLGVDGGVFIP